jgi:hypothetical protein
MARASAGAAARIATSSMPATGPPPLPYTASASVTASANWLVYSSK